MAVTRCVWSVCVLLVCGLPPCVCVNIDVDGVTVLSGEDGSLFGFSVDFHLVNETAYVVVGAPRANTSQSGVMQGGAVFLCPWTQGGGACDIITFDQKGDEEFLQSSVFQTSKSHQWFGATVKSVGNRYLLGCAPLFHWNVLRKGEESGNAPVGNCLLLDQLTGSSTPFSPCRGSLVDKEYKGHDQRYCEVGFSSDVTKEGRLVLGAPGSFYFRGQVFTVAVGDILASGRSHDPIPYVFGVTQSTESRSVGYDRYHGYSVASGQLTGDPTIDYLVGAPNDRNTVGTVQIYDGQAWGSLRVSHTFYGTQVASYFGHSVAVADINSDGLDDVIVGAPLFMDRVSQHLQELGQVSVYLQKPHPLISSHQRFSSDPDQSLIGSTVYGRFGSALAALGDLNMDGYHDLAVGAPWAGEWGRGQVVVFLGNSNGLTVPPSQVIDSPLLSNRPAFGFTLRGGTDIDGNGYPDLLVGAWGADKAFVYRSQAVIQSMVSLSLFPSFLNPESKLCQLENITVSCFIVQVCVEVSGHRLPQQIEMEAELQMDKMKQPMARRTLLLSTNQAQTRFLLTVQRDMGVACVNHSAYLRADEDVGDKMSPIFIHVDVHLHPPTHTAVLHGHTHTNTQTRIILDCGDDNVCIPDLKLSAVAGTDSVVVGADQSLVLKVEVENSAEGAYETQLVIRTPQHTHYQGHTQGVSRLVCVQKRENQTTVVVCDLGNPMKNGTLIQASLLFSVGHLEEVESHVTFSLKVRSRNSGRADEEVLVHIPVLAESELDIRSGSSPPEVVLPLPDWTAPVHNGSLQEVGPDVEHVYELWNAGPATVDVRLTVHFPSTLRGHFLLYVYSNASHDHMTCSPDDITHIDPYGLAGNSTEVPLFSHQEDSHTLASSLEIVNCSSPAVGCLQLHCLVSALRGGASALVRINAKLWMDTLTQTPYVNYQLMSSASYEVIAVSSRVQPSYWPHGETQTQTNVLWRGPDGEKEVPIGYLLLSILSGLLLLSLLSVLFWKLGFFNRTRPPSDEADDEEQLATSQE